MTTTPTFTDPDVDPFKRDQWGRPLAPHPVTGELRRWTRITTMADALAEKTGLHRWDLNCVAYGLPRLPYDIIRQALEAEDPKDKDHLKPVVQAAQEAAGANHGRDIGTAIHAGTEAVQRYGADIADLDPEIRDDVRAYIDTFEAAGFTIHEDDHGPFIERFVMLPQLDDGKSVAGVAGSPDRYVWYDGRLYVLEIKTGQESVRFEMTKTPLQCALQAHATHWWDPHTDTGGEVPRPDFEKAIIAHVPAGTGHCELYFTPINWGWRMVELAQKVRVWQRVKPYELLEQFTPMRAGPTMRVVTDNGTDDKYEQELEQVEEKRQEDLLTARIEWITDRCKLIQRWSEPDHHRGPADQSPYKKLANLWANEHPEIAYFRNGGPTTHQQVDAIAAMCDQIEDGTTMPFPSPDPGQPKTTKATQAKAKATAKASKP